MEAASDRAARWSRAKSRSTTRYRSEKNPEEKREQSERQNRSEMAAAQKGGHGLVVEGTLRGMDPQSAPEAQELRRR